MQVLDLCLYMRIFFPATNGDIIRLKTRVKLSGLPLWCASNLKKKRRKTKTIFQIHGCHILMKDQNFLSGFCYSLKLCHIYIIYILIFLKSSERLIFYLSFRQCLKFLCLSYLLKKLVFFSILLHFCFTIKTFFFISVSQKRVWQMFNYIPFFF